MSVYKRAGSPYYQYEFEIDAGKHGRGGRFRGSTKCTSERDALAFEKAERERRRLELAGALAREKAPDTVSEVFARYWRAHGHKLSWADTVKDHMREMRDFLGAETPFADVGNAEVSRMLEHYATQTTYKLRGGKTRAGKPVSNGTINRRLAVIRNIHNMARDLWELPVKGIIWKHHKRKEAKERVRHVTAEQARDVVGRLPPHILQMAAWSFATGCRLNETETLTWARINHETGQAEVETKGGGTRFVNLSPEARQILAMCDPRGALVFDSTNRRKHWEAACKAAKLKDFHWHDMRHSFATWMGQGGSGLHVIQKALGHADIRATMKYLHVIRADVQAAVASLPALIESNVVAVKRDVTG